MNEYYIMHQNSMAMKPPNTVHSQSIQSQGQPCSLSLSSRQEAATMAEYIAVHGDKAHRPTIKPPTRCL